MEMLTAKREEDARPEGYDDEPEEGYRGEDVEDGSEEAANGVEQLSVADKS